MTKHSDTPRTFDEAMTRAHHERSRAFHDGLHALTAWISRGKLQGTH